jgi:hypothetical protein
MSAKLVERATSLDAELREQWAQMKKLARVVGGLFKEIRDNQLHKLIRKPDSRKGYLSFEEYASALTGGVANSTVWFFMSIHSLTEGPSPVPAEDVDEMPQSNAYQLSKLKPELRTREIVEKAKITPIKKFQADIQEIRNKSLPPEQRKPVLVDFHEKWPPEIVEMFEDTITDFCLLDVVRDGDYAMAIRHKAIATVLVSARTHVQDELEEARLRNEARGTAEEAIREMAASAQE